LEMAGTTISHSPMVRPPQGQGTAVVTGHGVHDAATTVPTVSATKTKGHGGDHLVTTASSHIEVWTPGLAALVKGVQGFQQWV
jgi:hypothetical protein